MRLGVLAALCLSILVTGCGAVTEAGYGTSTAQAEETAGEEILPAPPLEGIDEEVPAEALATLFPPLDDLEDCGTDEGINPVYPELSEEDCLEMVEEIEASERSHRPAEGETPRAVARLRLADGGAARFVEFTSQAGYLCGAVMGDESAAGSISPCIEEDNPYCREMCLSPAAAVDSLWMVYAGTVDAAADGIRLTFEDGTTARYPLTGPLSRLDPSRRIFMVELSGDDPFPPVQELLEGETVVERLDLDNPDLGGLEPDLEDIFTSTPGVELELDGRTLRVEIGPEAPADARALLADDEIVFVCVGTDELEDLPDDPDELPPAHAFGRFPPGERAVTVELRAPVAGRPVACSLAADVDLEGEPPVAVLLLPLEELVELFDLDE